MSQSKRSMSKPRVLGAPYLPENEIRIPKGMDMYQWIATQLWGKPDPADDGPEVEIIRNIRRNTRVDFRALELDAQARRERRAADLKIIDALQKQTRGAS